MTGPGPGLHCLVYVMESVATCVRFACDKSAAISTEVASDDSIFGRSLLGAANGIANNQILLLVSESVLAKFLG
jgi:hypothetical protein